MLQAADLTIRLHPEDDVVIARTELPAGTLIQKENVRTGVRVPAGHKVAVRAVAQACASNKLALLVPCHRVVRSDGDLAGYRWGIERKRELIARERAAAPADAAAD